MPPKKKKAAVPKKEFTCAADTSESPVSVDTSESPVSVDAEDIMSELIRFVKDGNKLFRKVLVGMGFGDEDIVKISTAAELFEVTNMHLLTLLKRFLFPVAPVVSAVAPEDVSTGPPAEEVVPPDVVHRKDSSTVSEPVDDGLVVGRDECRASSREAAKKVVDKNENRASSREAVKKVDKDRNKVSHREAVKKAVDKEKSKNSSKEVVDKVESETNASPHKVCSSGDGGAVVCSPSCSDRKKDEGSTGLGRQGPVDERMKSKIVVQRVLTAISVDKFMKELYHKNVEDIMSWEVFSRSIYIASGNWQAVDKEYTNVVLGCSPKISDRLLATGAHILWFTFDVRRYDFIRPCFRCLGFDHKVQDCRNKEDVCRRCGVPGHRAAQCSGELHCRNCALRGLSAGHSMLSSACPFFAAASARANARRKYD